jgi:hypothetical protein
MARDSVSARARGPCSIAPGEGDSQFHNKALRWSWWLGSFRYDHTLFDGQLPMCNNQLDQVLLLMDIHSEERRG